MSLFLMILIACGADSEDSNTPKDTSDTGRDTSDLWFPLDTSEGYH